MIEESEAAEAIILAEPRTNASALSDYEARANALYEDIVLVKANAMASARSEDRAKARALSESEARVNSESITLARANSESITMARAEAITRAEVSFLAEASEHAKAAFRQMFESNDRSADRARKRTDVFDKISNAAMIQIQTVSQDEATAASSVFAKFDSRYDAVNCAMEQTRDRAIAAARAEVKALAAASEHAEASVFAVAKARAEAKAMGYAFLDNFEKNP